MKVSFTRAVGVALTVVLAVALSGAVATAVPARHHFKQVFLCGFAVPTDNEVSARWISVGVGAGHWTTYDNTIGDPCWGEDNETWHPTAGRFTVTLRWYAGKSLLKKQTRSIGNRSGATFVNFSHRGMTGGSQSGVWRLHGKKVWVKVTVHKKGWASTSRSTSHFLTS